MIIRRMFALSFAGLAAVAAASPGDFTLVVDSPRGEQSEDSALHGFVMLKDGASGARAVGTVGRAYSTSSGGDNTVWGVVTEAINLPGARGNVVGLEAAAVNMSPDNSGELRGIDVVYKNRMDLSLGDAVPAVGQNRFNDKSAALYVSSQPRSPAGEYSGWQAGIRFAPNSVDRSASVPYAVAIDASDVQVDAPFYLIVWRCGAVKCGLKPTDGGMTVAVDIERAP